MSYWYTCLERVLQHVIYKHITGRHFPDWGKKIQMWWWYIAFTAIFFYQMIVNLDSVKLKPSLRPTGVLRLVRCFKGKERKCVYFGSHSYTATENSKPIYSWTCATHTLISRHLSIFVSICSLGLYFQSFCIIYYY